MDKQAGSQKRIVLSLNSGSSSLKFGLYTLQGSVEERLASGSAEGLGTQQGRVSLRKGDQTLLKEDRTFSGSKEAAGFLLKALTDQSLPAPSIIGHRIVHGGPRLREHRRITPEVLKELEEAIPFAPIHLPPALDVIYLSMERFANAPQVACLDTAFHRTMPEQAARLPFQESFWREGIRKYGFHGLSCESIVHSLGRDLANKTIIAHLGNGASLTAVKDGQSIETTMGLTPTGGVIMGTRSGDLDPGVLLHLIDSTQYGARQIERLVNHEAGLVGISGKTSDMRMLLEASGSDTSARLAVQMFCYSVRKALGALAAVLDGVELLVFAGGIGEHAAPIRENVCKGLGHLGIVLESEANTRSDEVISAPGSRCTVRVVASDEDLQIARHCARLA